ncbi:hypothetical protein Aperf_G00000047050 [Anoplocephala perfoliata]
MSLRSHGVQTLYRDSETQTIPYSPEYTIPVGETPQILYLSHLKYGNGLPVGQREIIMVERAEKRRVMEAAIANLPAKERISLRRSLELDEWKHRAREIEALQEIRLQVIAQLLLIREENRKVLNTKRLSYRWNCQQKEKSNALAKIRSQYATAVHKLLHAMERKRRVAKPDKIEIYSNPSSQVFAPFSRYGVFLDRGAEMCKVRSRFLDSIEGLSELENFIPKGMLDARIVIKKPSLHTRDGYLKQRARWQAKLESLHEFTKAQDAKDLKVPKPLRYLSEIERSAPRPLTPSVPEINSTRDEGEVAVIKLQRMIRGRTFQTMMYELRRKRQLLINELRSTHALTKEERAEKRRQMLTARSNQTRFEHLKYENDKVHEIIERLDATALGRILDLLSKELDRLLVDERLNEYVQRARNERRMREVEESSRRQWEERRRREQDEFFRQIVKLHRDTVDGYFSILFDNAMEAAAELKASRELDMIAEKWPAEVECAERTFSHEEEAAELVDNFLIREVNRRYYRATLQRQERKYLSAAHSEIFREVEFGSLGAKIRDFEQLKKDQATSVHDEEIDKKVASSSSEEEDLDIRRLRAHEYDCED